MTDQAEEHRYLYASAEDARAFVAGVLERNGVPPANASIVSQCLVEADLRGVDTHGINRIPSYLKRVRQGVLDPAASPKLKQITPVVAQIDGKNAFGFLSGVMAIDAACDMAETYGIGMVGVKRSNHFGMSASYVLRAVERNMMSLVFTNSSPALPVWGGREKILGVSPIACGAPAGDTVPFVVDMAPSVAARGKIYKALRRGETIPEDWALDGEGNRTEDPAEALKGVMLPMGGPKGSALAMMMDVFSGVFSGSAFAGEVTGPYDPSKEADVGHFIVAVKPDLFMSLEDFKSRMDYLYKKVVACEKMRGVDRIYYPGEIEILRQKERQQTGIPYVASEVDALNKEAETSNAPLLKVSTAALNSHPT